MTKKMPFKQFLWAVTALLAIYFLVSVGTFLYPNPFAVAQAEAQVLGGWEAEQVEFRSGAYRIRPFGSAVEAELLIFEKDEPFQAAIELSHSPVFGWQVQTFKVLEPLG